MRQDSKKEMRNSCEIKFSRASYRTLHSYYPEASFCRGSLYAEEGPTANSAIVILRTHSRGFSPSPLCVARPPRSSSPTTIILKLWLTIGGNQMRVPPKGQFSVGPVTSNYRIVNTEVAVPLNTQIPTLPRHSPDLTSLKGHPVLIARKATAIMH
eukprot:scaffold20092_cov65-Skeletonema_dohrnii-CCMP3373.AAC.1